MTYLNPNIGDICQIETNSFGLDIVIIDSIDSDGMFTVSNLTGETYGIADYNINYIL